MYVEASAGHVRRPAELASQNDRDKSKLTLDEEPLTSSLCAHLSFLPFFDTFVDEGRNSFPACEILHFPAVS
jgi:hypothetical protein